MTKKQVFSRWGLAPTINSIEKSQPICQKQVHYRRNIISLNLSYDGWIIDGNACHNCKRVEQSKWQ
jgi:hypothetical protein